MDDQISPPPDDPAIPRKKTPGNRTERRGRVGRAGGVRNIRTRETDRLLEQLGGDPPHIALLKLSRDEKVDLSLRAQMAAWAAPYFASKMAPKTLPRFLADAPDLGRLTDAESTVGYVAAVAEGVRSGKLDVEAGQFFLNCAAIYARLHAALNLENEVEKARASLQLAAE
jgi:hypothetical protein